MKKMKKETWLTILVGLPRSGKTTWMTLNKKESDIVVSSDWIREKILKIPYSKATNAIIWTLLDATLRILLSQGKNVILDGVNHTEFVRNFYTEIARECGAKIKMVIFSTSLETCLKRNAKKHSHKLPDDKIKKMCGEMKYPALYEYDEIEYQDE